MSASTNTSTDIRAVPYADNDEITVADRLSAEIGTGATDLSIVSGYFSPGVWKLVGNALEEVTKFRLLLGKDHELDQVSTGEETRNIERLVRSAIRKDAEPQRLITPRDATEIAGLIGFLERMRTEADDGDEVVKLWRGDAFFHAKAYICRSAHYGGYGVGSANFTYNGLSENRELVGWNTNWPDVGKLVDWFDRHWAAPEAVGYTQELIDALRATPLVSETFSPYDVLIRTLAARYGEAPPPQLEGTTLRLHWFQEDAVQRLLRLLNGPAKGALLADAVGLGKTFMAMRVIEHYLYGHAEERRGRGQPVLLIVPAALLPYWQESLEEQGLTWACRLITMQSLRRDFDPRQFAGADLVVIDEAHRLRGEGVWFRAASDLLTAGADIDKKRVLLLTATPVNTSMRDLVNLLRLLTKNRYGVWQPDIVDFDDYLKQVEKGNADPFPVLDRSLVRRSRSDILRMAAERNATGIPVEDLKLPKRRPQHIDYDYSTANVDMFAEFAKGLRRLVLAPYDLDRFKVGEDAGRIQLSLPGAHDAGEDDDLPRFSPGSLAALCAAGLLNRFQSSLPAIERSLKRVDAVQARFLEALEQETPKLLNLTEGEVRRLLAEESADTDRDEEEDGTADERHAVDALDARWQAAIAQAPPLPNASEYDLTAIRAAIAEDRQTITKLLGELPPRDQDGKIDALLEALRRLRKDTKVGAPGLAASNGVLIFTQYRDTARYVHSRLRNYEDEFGPILITDGAVPSEKRRERTAFFDPARAENARMPLVTAGETIPRMLVSTDVLAEGHNLQVADTVINFDLHFNPQVAVQRAGRIDRLGSRNPQVFLVSMLPPEDLNLHLRLLERLDERFRRIHSLGLGDERVTTLRGDQQVKTLEQIRRLYQDDDERVLDEIELTWTFGSTDYMRSPLTSFMHAKSLEALKSIPIGVSSVKRLPQDWKHGEGVFVCLATQPTSDGDRQTFWRFYPRASGGAYGPALRDDVAIFRAISCHPGEPRAELADHPPGPGIFDWELISRAAIELAEELNQASAQAELYRGASQKSNALRREVLGQTADFDEVPDGLDDLLDRLEQVRIEDYDARTKGSDFYRARRDLKTATTRDDRYAAATLLAATGLELLGAPADDQAAPGRDVRPEDLQLISYEVLLAGASIPSPAAMQPAQIALLPEFQPTLTPDA